MLRPLDTLTAVVLATRMRARDVLEATSTVPHDDPIAWAAAIAARPGEKWALIAGDRAIAMGGAMPLWPGVMSTWLVASEELPGHGLELLRAVRQLHEALAKDGVRRFQTVCMSGYTVGRRFLDRLGYVVEGHARAFGKRGEDYDFMARIEGEPHHG